MHYPTGIAYHTNIYALEYDIWYEWTNKTWQKET